MLSHNWKTFIHLRNTNEDINNTIQEVSVHTLTAFGIFKIHKDSKFIIKITIVTQGFKHRRNRNICAQTSKKNDLVERFLSSGKLKSI